MTIKTTLNILVVLCALPALSLAQVQTFADSRDQNTYTATTIGSQMWMLENLSYHTDESWCYNDSAQCRTDGRVYTYFAALSACPEGWRLPSDKDWMQLEKALGMSDEEVNKINARGDIGVKLENNSPYKFDMLYPGYRRPDGSYTRKGERVAYWTSTEFNSEDAWHRDFRPGTPTVYRSPVTKTYALSVRCIRNSK